MKEMKKILIILSALVLTITSCKKDYLTKEELQEELANQEQPNNDMPGWELLLNTTYNHKGTLYNFINDVNFIEGFSHFDIKWRNNYNELIIDLDTNGFGTTNYNTVINNPQAKIYLNKMFTSNKYYDVLEIIELNSQAATFYSKELKEFIHTEKI